MKCVFGWKEGNRVRGRFASFRGLRQALAGFELDPPDRIALALEDAISIGLVNPTEERAAETCIAGRVYTLALYEASPMAEIGRQGGRANGAAKRRGDSEYYRQLVSKRRRR